MSRNYGSFMKKRQSNENLYNVVHANRMQSLDFDQESLREYKQMAEGITEEMRAQFKQAREHYWSLPRDQRVPHFIDKDRVAKPYSEEVLARNQEEFPDQPFYGLDNVMLRDADEVIHPVTVEELLRQQKD